MWSILAVLSEDDLLLTPCAHIFFSKRKSINKIHLDLLYQKLKLFFLHKIFITLLSLQIKSKI